MAALPRSGEPAGRRGSILLSTRDTKKDATEATWSMECPASRRCSKPAQVGLHHFSVALSREYECDVDVEPGRHRPANGRDPGWGRRYLDHEIGPRNAGPELFGLSHRPVRIVGKMRADLNAHVAITAISSAHRGERRDPGRREHPRPRAPRISSPHPSPTRQVPGWPRRSH